MSAPKLQSSGHSADVRIQLCVNGRILPVAQLGPDFLVLKDTLSHPATEAEIAMWIDGHERRWQVRLIDGIVAGQRRTRIGGCG